MTKIEAIGLLHSRKCDVIYKGSSEFILDKGSIINKRSKKALDLKDLSEDEWESKSFPKWYDELSERMLLVMIESGGIPCVATGAVTDEESGEVSIVVQDGRIFNCDEISPMTRDEASQFLVNGKKIKVTPRTKPQPTRKEAVGDINEREATEVHPQSIEDKKEGLEPKNEEIREDIQVELPPKEKTVEMTQPTENIAEKKVEAINEDAKRAAVIKAASEGVSARVAALRERYEAAGVEKNEWHLFYQFMRDELGIVIEHTSGTDEDVVNNIKTFREYYVPEDTETVQAPLQQEVPVENNILKELLRFEDSGLDIDDREEFIEFFKLDKFSWDDMKKLGDSNVVDQIAVFYSSVS